jgi:hypothetical protein
MNAFEIVMENDRIMSSLKQDIKNSKYKVQYFLELLNLKSGFFYKKINEKRFTSEEMKILAKHLYPDAYQEYQERIIDEALAVSKEEIRTGEAQEFLDCLAEVKAKINAL